MGDLIQRALVYGGPTLLYALLALTKYVWFLPLEARVWPHTDTNRRTELH